MLTCPKCGTKDPTILLQPKVHINRKRTVKSEGKPDSVLEYTSTLARKTKCCKCGIIDYMWRFNAKKYAAWKSAKRGRPKKAESGEVADKETKKEV